MNPNIAAKRRAARAAIEELPREGVIGLGSGSTAHLFVEELARCVKEGRRLVGVPTSEATRAHAASLGIPLLDDVGPWSIDVAVDGADEVSARLDLIKGGGGAHAREKIVNFAARRNIIVVDSSKLSTRLGEKHAIPLEILPFAHGTTRKHLGDHGEARLRMAGSEPARTDAGNMLCDLRVGPIEDAPALDRALRAIPGVVETGLFIGRADVVLVADEAGVRRLEP
ncbi:MAG TPA: ribose-5-phosphate isomerase RpiA [Polyangiaceae bacterium]|nr:ribose-5-phosphate isomerase RpiA [Polyangiaceae bacterium]